MGELHDDTAIRCFTTHVYIYIEYKILPTRIAKHMMIPFYSCRFQNVNRFQNQQQTFSCDNRTS